MALNRQRLCSPLVAKVALGLLALCLAGYIVGPPLYWHLMEGLAAVSRSSSSSLAYYSCPPCLCDCSSEPLLSIPQGLSNSSFADCAKHDPEVSEDTEKNFAELLSEELKLREAESTENQQRADMALLEAKKIDIPVSKGGRQVQFRNGNLRRGSRKSQSEFSGTKKADFNVGAKGSSKRLERRCC